MLNLAYDIPQSISHHKPIGWSVSFRALRTRSLQCPSYLEGITKLFKYPTSHCIFPPNRQKIEDLRVMLVKKMTAEKVAFSSHAIYCCADSHSVSPSTLTNVAAIIYQRVQQYVLTCSISSILICGPLTLGDWRGLQPCSYSRHWTAIRSASRRRMDLGGTKQ